MNNLILKQRSGLIRANDFESEVFLKELEIDKSTDSVDEWMDEFVRNKLDKEYDNIFLPLSIGDVASDFLGLRLAMHIRTMDGYSCQLSNLVLYSPTTYEEVMQFSQLFGLLSTRGVFLVDYSREAISKNLSRNRALHKKNEVRQELEKLHLRVPENYFDFHSIANIWGAFRLCKIANIDIDKIESLKNEKRKLKDIYFKWLFVINDLENIRNDEVEQTDKSYSKKLRGLKKKGRIDLSNIPK
jgi:hypothetical protein